MMTFIMITAGVMIGTLLASGVAFAIMMHPKVMKAYMRKMQELMNDICDTF